MQRSFHALDRVASLEGIFDFDIYEQSLLNIKAPSNYLWSKSSRTLIGKFEFWSAGYNFHLGGVCWIKAQFVTDIGKGCKINCSGRQDIKEIERQLIFISFSSSGRGKDEKRQGVFRSKWCHMTGVINLANLFHFPPHTFLHLCTCK